MECLLSNENAQWELTVVKHVITAEIICNNNKKRKRRKLAATYQNMLYNNVYHVQLSCELEYLQVESSMLAITDVV